MLPPSSGAGGWSPSDSDHYQWLQVDFGNRKQISAIATQGRYSSSDWVTQYRMLYSDTGRNWKPYHQDGNIWVSRCQKGKHRTEWQICDPNPPSPGGVLGRWKGLGVTWLKVNCAIFVSCLSVCVLWYLLKEKRNVSEAKESGEMDLNPIVPCPTPCLS